MASKQSIPGLLLLGLILGTTAHAATITLDPFQRANYEATLPDWVSDYNAIYHINSPLVSLDFAVVPQNVYVGLFTSEGVYTPIFPNYLTSEGSVYSADLPPDPGATYLLSLSSFSAAPVSVDLNDALFGFNPVDPPLPSAVPEPAGWELASAGVLLLAAMRRMRHTRSRL